MPMKNPPHPGDLIKTEVIEALGLDVSKGGGYFEGARRAAGRPIAGRFCFWLVCLASQP